MLCVLISAYALFANAQTALEDTNGQSKRMASYSHQFLEARYAPSPSKYQPVGNGECVNFVQAHGYSDFRGNAWEWARYINSNKPLEGGVVVLKEGPAGHLAIITEVVGDSIYLVEQNYEAKYVVSTRKITIDNPAIVGFIR